MLVVAGEREVFATSAPEADTTIDEIAILTSPEVVADERKKNLSDFVNPVTKPATADYLVKRDIFSLTAEGFDGTPTVGNIVELQNGSYKLNAVASATGATVVGKIVDFVNGKYAVKVD